MNKYEIEDWEDLVGLPIDNANEFLDGCRDCDEGIPERDGMGRDYRRGYAAQYQLEHLREKGFIK